MNYKFTTILILLFFSPNVFAFPVAESISLYSIFSYWFFSLFASGGYLLGDKYKYRFYKILSIIIVAAFALTIGFISYNQKIEMNTSVNSLSFNFKYLKAKPYAITAKEEDEIKKYLLDLERDKINIFEDLGVFFKKNKETKFIYLHEEQELKTANPTINTIFKYEDGKENELLNFVDNYTGEYKIYASNPVKAAHVSLKIFKRTGKITTVVLQSPQMMSDVRSYAAIKNPFLQEQIDKKTVKKTSWNEADLMDVSTYFEVMEKHAVVQAELFPVENVWQMTDNEVIAWLVRNKGKKFISFNHSNLVILENRLQRLSVDLNQFNISYIQQFYENNGSGYPITPYFFNNGSTYTTEVLRDELIKTDDIKILCFSYDKCKLKIPTERFDVINVNPFVDNFAEEFKKIDKTKKYVAVIDNRYEYGWAVKYGYWMNTNKDYANFLGIYYLPQRLDYYEWLKTNLDNEHQFKGTSVYEKLYGVMNEIINVDKEDPKNVLLKFFVLGGLVKLTLIAIFGWMYFSRNTKLKTAYSLLNVVTLISIVYSLTWILERYSLVPFFWYSNISYNYELVFLCFMGLLSLSCFIKTQSIKITAVVSLTLLIMYITGFIYSINVVVAIFIIGLEVFNVLFELYFLHKTRSKYKGVGIYKTMDALNSNLLKTKKFPEKWLLVNKYRKTDGYLVDLSGKT